VKSPTLLTAFLLYKSVLLKDDFAIFINKLRIMMDACIATLNLAQPQEGGTIDHRSYINLHRKEEQGTHRHRLSPRIATPLHASPYSLLGPNVTLFIKPKYITHRNAARGGLSHGHGGSAPKMS